MSETVSLLRAIEREFRSRSASGDDAEVRSLLLGQADRSAVEADLLLDFFAGDESQAVSEPFLDTLPVALTRSHALEEQTVLDLSYAFTAINLKRAHFRALLLQLNNSGLTDKLNDASRAAEQAASAIFHLIPTRSKIAFNMLTPNELDPSVETRASDSRLV